MHIGELRVPYGITFGRVMINGTPVARSDVGGLATPSPGTVIVPNVLGMKWSAARREILSSGLRVQYQVVTGGYTSAVVTQQRPKGDASVTPDIVVQVVLGPA